jgi:cystathionine beta-lyase/cystathionine gamma-synthase
MTEDEMNISYIINILGEDENSGVSSVTPPIYQTSNFYFKTVADFRDAISDEK